MPAMTSLQPPFRLSIPAMLLAPVPAPAVFAALFVFGGSGQDRMMFFLVGLSFGYLLGITGTSALALALLFIGRRRPVSLALTTLLGVVLAGIAYASFLYIGWTSSGSDSGPPMEPFSAYASQSWNDPFGWAFLVCGLVTAVIYHLLTLRFLARRARV